MNPVQGFTMLRFLNWLVVKHPEIESLEAIPTFGLLHLAAEFEGQPLHGQLTQKWEVGFKTLLKTNSDWKGYAEARTAARKLGSRSDRRILQERHPADTPVDPIRRYRSVPLHAVFLYSSEDHAIASYITANWRALDRMSGEFCDIHPSLEQLRGLEDAYSALDAVPEVIGGIGRVEISKLPGIMFWDELGRTEYVSFKQALTHDAIRDELRIIFEQIRIDPTIPSVRLARSRIPADRDAAS